MNKKQASILGKATAKEVCRYGVFTPAEKASSEAFLGACGEILENRRQYFGDVSYEFARQSNSENLFDAFDAAFDKECEVLYKKVIIDVA